jgi:peptidyl-tRNA hydrolase ICT1
LQLVDLKGCLLISPRTESKATTTWSVAELETILPRVLHSKLRSSSYYSKRSDSLSLQAQTERNRGSNLEENRQKLFNELVRIYREAVPGETSPEKKQKHEAM